MLIYADIGSWAVSAVLFSVLLSKLISVNIGVSKLGVVMSIGSMSKSVGRGNKSFSCNAVSGASLFDGGGMFCTDVLSLLRADINDLRISGGMSGRKSSVVSVFSGSDSLVVSAAFCSSLAFAWLKMTGTFGFGIVTNGFFVRSIIVVVAIYSGMADKSIIPKTNPPKPRSSARASLCHWAPLNMLNLNIKYKIAHVQNM